MAYSMTASAMASLSPSFSPPYYSSLPDNNGQPRCQIDRSILNEQTISTMTDIGVSFFESVCGKNRGAFVVDPPDGHTYGCLALPTNITEIVGVESVSSSSTLSSLTPHPVPAIPDANSIKEQYVAGNITGKQAIDLLDFLVIRSYESTPNKDTNPYACDVNGLAKLSCTSDGPGPGPGDDTKKTPSRSPRSDGQPIRSVTLVGLLVPDQPWATTTTTTGGEKTNTLIQYTTQDYQEMLELGLNTVQISVPTSVFNNKDKNGQKLRKILDQTLQEIQQTTHTTTTTSVVDVDTGQTQTQNNIRSLQVILSLVSTGNEVDLVVLASIYAASKTKKHNGVILALTLPETSSSTDNTKIMIDSIRASHLVGSNLSLFIPYTATDLLTSATTSISKSRIDDPNVYGSVSWSHTQSTSIGDIASSTSEEDRSKMFYHENVACTMRSPIEHSACSYQHEQSTMPIFWSQGFDLSIDDCVFQPDDATNPVVSSTSSNTVSVFQDYGQCNRFDETIHSPWWKRHRLSFASRQVYAAERGLGWSFASWKVGNTNDNNDNDTDEDGDRVIDQPVQLLAFQQVVQAGLFPDLVSNSTTGTASTTPGPATTTNTKVITIVAPDACLNPPDNDFALGDATLAPTPAPIPDCGNGWWNATTTKCDYWIPPVTLAPTLSPTQPCPDCQKCPEPLQTSPPSSSSPATTTSNRSSTSTMALLMAGLGGAAMVLILGVIHHYCIGPGNSNNKRKEYEEIPTNNEFLLKHDNA